jgi:hypothetical protein
MARQNVVPAFNSPVPKAAASGPTFAPATPVIGGNQTAQELQSAASMSIPAVQTVAPVSLSTGVRELKRFPLVLASGASFALSISGNYVFVEFIRTPNQGTAQPEYLVNMKPDSSSVTIPLSVEGQEFRFETDYNQLQFQNLNGGDCALVVWVGYGSVSFPFKYESRNYEAAATGAAIAAAVHPINNIVTTTAISPPVFPFTSLVLSRFRLVKSSTTTAGANFLAYIFNAAPTAPLGSNIAWQLRYADRQSLAGIIALPNFITGGAGSDMTVCDVSGLSIPISAPLNSANPSAYDPLAANQLTVVIVASAAYTSPGENCVLETTFASR